MLNFKPHPVTLKRNLLVASIIFPDNVSSITPFKNNNDQEAHKKFVHAKKPSEEVLESFVAKYKLNLSPKLTIEQRSELMNVLYQNKDVFARDISEIKTYKNFELELKPRSCDIKRTLGNTNYQSSKRRKSTDKLKK